MKLDSSIDAQAILNKAQTLAQEQAHIAIIGAGVKHKD